VQPLYFGDARRPLFGVYHPPQGTRPRDLGVVLCYPAPQEYMGSHWAMRKLALAVAREGLPVFRFDYYGTGDSAGETSDGTLEQWRQDITAACDEIKDIAGVRRVSVVGFRLGAALAAQAALKVRDLVLWEPVVEGRAYLEELREIHARIFAHCLYPPRVGPSGAMGELMGLVLPAAQEEATARVVLAQPLACKAERVVIVVSQRRPQYEKLAAHLAGAAAAGGTPVVFDCVEEAQRSGDEPFLLSSRAQQTIAARLAGRSP
jgi:uncharacterized protein